MEMESTRSRPFDRSAGAAAAASAMKKPRLTEDPSNPNGRQFRPSSVPASATSAAAAAATARFRVMSERDSDGGAYHPQPAIPAQQQQQQQQPYHELLTQYKRALAELTFNSKPIITNLTIIAGENLHAAKAIVSTICANIIEVPSDQKLPSLYLLDSIVKNIMGDYIKYFGARLYEVFCKAYRQVDPSVHQSMRHLFGTWKGVFPPQTLQMIEKELGFSSPANGSSSNSVTSRSDSQTRRQSIHINPKILEIQHIQQSSRAKGMASDLAIPMEEDVERPERAASLAAGRPRVDPAVKIHNIQRSQREVLSDPVHQKKIVPGYGDFEYSSDISRNLGKGIGRSSGRVAEQGHEKPWYGAGNNVTETISSQKNGFSVKHSLPNYSAPIPPNLDSHLLRTHGTVSKSSSAMSASWKHSEEEEFMWDMRSRLSDQDASTLSTNSGKDRWTPDGSEKLDFENQFRKPASAHEVMSRFDRENSSDSQSTEQKEQVPFVHRLPSPWQLKESHPNDELADAYPGALAGLSASSSLARMPIRSHGGTSVSGFSTSTPSGSPGTFGHQRFQSLRPASPSGQSSMHHHPNSPPFPARYPHQQLQNSAEQDLPQYQSLPRPDYKAQPFSGNIPPSSVQIGGLKKVKNEDLSKSVSSVQPNRQYRFPQPKLEPEVELSGELQKSVVPKVSTSSPLVKTESEFSAPLGAETSGKSSTSSLLAAVMSSGILSSIGTAGLTNKSIPDVGKMTSQSSIPPLPSGPPPHFKSSETSIIAASANDVSVPLIVSQSKEKQPPLPPGLPPSSVQSSNGVNKAANPISNLLSSLVAKGLITAAKSETSSPSLDELPAQSQTQKTSVSDASSKPNSSVQMSSATSPSSSKNERALPKPDIKPSAIAPQPTSAERKGLIGLQFKPDVIRELHPQVISELFDGFKHHCSKCGLQLKLKGRLDRHLEWHTCRKPELDGVRVSRRWYLDSGSWVAAKAEVPYGFESSASVDKTGTPVENDEPMVLADEDQCVCVLCGEVFEDYFCQEKNKWMFKEAMHLTLPLKDRQMGTTSENSEGPIVHVKCVSESSIHELGLMSNTKMDKDG